MTEAPKKKMDAEGWARMLIGAAVTIVTTYNLFVTQIHGYIDEISEREQTRITHTMSGFMLILQDSINAEATKRDNAMLLRMARMDSTHQVLERQNAAIIRQLDRVLDVSDVR